MPSISESHIEQEKAALVASFMAVAQSMKNCARMAETFAGYIKEGTVSPADAKLFPIPMDFTKLDAQGGASTTRKRSSKETAEGNTGKRARKEKKPKDPNAPKRPPSAYLLYQNAVRDETRQKFPDVPYQVLLAEISKAWHNLNDAERQPYLDATKLSKEAFLQKKADYDQGKADGVVALDATAGKQVQQPVAQTPSSEEEDEDSSGDEDPHAKPPPNGDSSSNSDSDEEEEEAPPKKKAKKNATPPPPVPAPTSKAHKKSVVPVTSNKKKKDKA